jgi:hypothetical protein
MVIMRSSADGRRLAIPENAVINAWMIGQPGDAL